MLDKHPHQLHIPDLVHLHGVLAYSKSANKVKDNIHEYQTLTVITSNGYVSIKPATSLPYIKFDDYYKESLASIKTMFADELKLQTEQKKQATIEGERLDRANLALLLKSDIYLEAVRLLAKYPTQ